MLGEKTNNINYKQFIPARLANPYRTSDNKYKGVCLNHLLIIEGHHNDNPYIRDNYFLQNRITADAEYTICLSKLYGFKPDYGKILVKTYKDEYVFYPDFHKLVEFGKPEFGKSDTIDSYVITDQDAICIIPELSYGKLIKEAQWEFINTSDPTYPSIIPPTDISEPFITSENESFLEPGYYTIIFRYRLAGEDQINTIKLDSAFLKV
jgi:hypothetical protein